MAKNNSRLKRLLDIRRIVKKYGLITLLDDLNLSKAARLGLKLYLGSPKSNSKPRAENVRLALEELGPIFVKLGQALSTRPDLLPADIADELTKLQDQVPAFDAQQSLKIIKANFADEYDAIFSNVELQPLASASVAQVHAATLNEGLAIQGQDGEAHTDVILSLIHI